MNPDPSTPPATPAAPSCPICAAVMNTCKLGMWQCPECAFAPKPIETTLRDDSLAPAATSPTPAAGGTGESARALAAYVESGQAPLFIVPAIEAALAALASTPPADAEVMARPYHIEDTKTLLLAMFDNGSRLVCDDNGKWFVRGIGSVHPLLALDAIDSELSLRQTTPGTREYLLNEDGITVAKQLDKERSRLARPAAAKDSVG